MKVKDVMRQSIEILSPDTPMHEIVEKFMTSQHNYFYLTDESGMIQERISQVELSPIAPEYETLKDFVLARDIATPNSTAVTEEDNLDDVMREFGKENVGEIPVISASNRTKILGTIWRLDVISAYNKEILKRDLAGEMSKSLSNIAPRRITELMEGYYVVEIDVPANFVDKKIKQLDVRNKYQVDIILIRKKCASGELVTEFPSANYVFHADDNLLLLGERENIEFISKL